MPTIDRMKRRTRCGFCVPCGPFFGTVFPWLSGSVIPKANEKDASNHENFTINVDSIYGACFTLRSHNLSRAILCKRTHEILSDRVLCCEKAKSQQEEARTTKLGFWAMRSDTVE